MVSAAQMRGWAGNRSSVQACSGWNTTSNTPAKNSGTMNCAITWKKIAPTSNMMASSTINEMTRGTYGLRMGATRRFFDTVGCPL